jgi:hypothetical protein
MRDFHAWAVNFHAFSSGGPNLSGARLSPYMVFRAGMDNLFYPGSTALCAGLIGVRGRLWPPISPSKPPSETWWHNVCF